MMNKLLVLLIVPSILFNWDNASASETQEFIAQSGGESKQSPRSRGGNIDSKGPRESNIDSRGPLESNIDSKGPRESNIDSKGPRESNIDSKGSLESNIDSKGPRERNIDSRGSLESNIDSKESRESNIDSKGSRESNIDLKGSRESNIDSKGSRETNKDSRGFREQQTKGPDPEPQRQQPQKPQFGKQELQEKNSSDNDRDWDRNRNQKRDIEQKKDLNDQKRSWESEKRDAVKTPDGYKDKDKDRTGNKRDRISKERLKEKEIRWKSKSKEWRKNFSNYKTRDHIFDDHFWNLFRRRNNNWYFDNNFQWFSGANWPRIVVWLPWAWSRPIYYFYETDGDVYYSTTEDFSYLIPVDSKEIFIEQATRIANARYSISKQQSDWMPLGMFAFALDNDSSDMPKRYISLAISKEGAVSGAYFDAANNTMLEIQGGIDPESQRIAWKFVGSDWPIMESGLYNLTKDESTLLIHTSSHTTETQVLIRLDK